MQVDEEDVDKRIQKIMCEAKKDGERVLMDYTCNEWGRPKVLRSEEKVFINRWYL